MTSYLLIAQMIVSAALIILILFQQRGTALGSTFGGEGTFYATLRGIQKKIFWATVIFAFLFIALALLSLVVS